jgi:hypothetical protein
MQWGRLVQPALQMASSDFLRKMKIQPRCGGREERVFFPIPALLVGCES